MKNMLLASAALSLLAACSSPEDRDAARVAELDDETIAGIDALIEEWAQCSARGDEVEALKTEKKIRKIADAHFAALRAGMLSGAENRRAVSAAAIGFTLDTGVIRILVELLKDKNPLVRSNSLLALSRIAYKRMPAESVLPSLEDDDPYVRRMAVICLEKICGVMNEKNIVPEICGMLTDSDPGVRINSAKALGVIANIEALDVLVKKGIQDKDPRVRYNSAIALARLKSHDSVEPIIEAGISEDNEAVLRELDHALVEITGKDWKGDFKNWKKWWLDTKAKKQ